MDYKIYLQHVTAGVMFKSAYIIMNPNQNATVQSLLSTVINRLSERWWVLMWVMLTQARVQRLGTILPVLAGLSAALQSLFQRGHPLLHLCFAVCSQEVAVAVLHLQLKAITPHLRTLTKESF